ncbi:MAG: SEC-C metal-binding domain-containing protein, partial [Polyangia bacterium]
MASTGRNDPCACGSGKKYKKCHLADDQAAASAPPQAPDPDELLASG